MQKVTAQAAHGSIDEYVLMHCILTPPRMPSIEEAHAPVGISLGIACDDHDGQGQRLGHRVAREGVCASALNIVACGRKSECGVHFTCKFCSKPSAGRHSRDSADARTAESFLCR